MDFTPDPEDGLVRRKEFVHNGGDAAELRRDHRQGRLVRVTRGVYRTVDPDEDTAEPVYDEAYRQLVIAIAGINWLRISGGSTSMFGPAGAGAVRCISTLVL